MVRLSKFTKVRHWLKCILSLCFMLTTQFVFAQKTFDDEFKKAPATRSVSSSLPSGYHQVGSTMLYYRQSSSSIDIIGTFNSRYYGSTYSNGGYRVAMKVGSSSAVSVDCLNGTTNNGVTFSANVLEQGELARICYTLTNTNAEDVVVSLGIHADVMIGSNDGAPISRRVDSFGSTYGLTLKDGNGAQLCVLFGSGLSGVTSVNDFWFGYYYLNNSVSAMVGNYSSGSNYMVENGSYDSGMGWCWKERTIAAGSTVVISWLIGVGDVNLEPSSSFEVTPDDPDGWNDLSRPHRLTLDGLYESPAGLSGVIDYAVEDSEEWIALTDTLESGDTFRDTLVATFTPNREKHVIRFRTRDLVGNTTMLPPIEYLDVSYYPVSGIEDKIYTGDSLYQTDLICDIEPEQYVAKNYRNNVNAGVASFNIEGVFPHTIGRKAYNFTILPATLEGSVVIADSHFVYNGYPQIPEWSFTESVNDTLKADIDYELVLDDNIFPGEATLSIIGKGNYSGVLSSVYTIDKAPLTEDLYLLRLPESDITYDELPHGASIQVADGVGEATLYYALADATEYSTEQPSEAGDYTIHLEFADGSFYYGRERAQVGTFTIYEFNAEEWAILQTVLPQLTEMGWSQPWDVSQGMKSVSSLHGLTIEKGHVTGLDLSGQNLTGMFPFVVLALPNLQNVNLANNHLTGDIGTATYVFAQQNPAMMTNVKGINISGNKFSGNIGLFANGFTDLTSLDASDNCLEDVYPVIPSTVRALDISKQTIARVVPLHLANLSVDSIGTKVPSILLYDHTNQTFTPNINLLCTTSDNMWGMTMAYQNGALSIPYVSEQNAYYGESGDTLNVAVLYNNGSREGSTFCFKLSFDEGDGNFDGKVNILDLQTTLNYMFEEYTNKPYNFTASNLWKDETINVQDAVCLVNMLLDANAVPVHQLNAAKRVATQASETSASVTIENGYLKINSVVPVSAFDITVSTSHQAEVVSALNDLGFICTSKQSSNNLHLVGYSLSGAEIPVGETAICELNSGIVSSAMLADRDANEISVTLNSGMATGIQFSKFNPFSQEVYRIPFGAKRAIVIDATGKKIMIKDEK